MWDFIYLASGSPRRRELLQQIGVPFRVVATGVDESVLPGEAPARYVARLAAAKAVDGWERSRGHGDPRSSEGVALPASDTPVLAADTAVVVGGRIFGKPKDRDDALGMLKLLSGRTHEVLTAVALHTGDGLQSRISRSEVTFRVIGAAEARDYWDTGEPHDKAGAYAIQGRAAVFISDLRGSYSGVMGLPLFETGELLHGAGWPCGRIALRE